jgi:hypothetical protein
MKKIPQLEPAIRFVWILITAIAVLALGGCSVEDGSDPLKNQSPDGVSLSVFTENFEARFFINNDQEVQAVFIFQKDGDRVSTVDYYEPLKISEIQLYRENNLVAVGGDFEHANRYPIVSIQDEVLYKQGLDSDPISFESLF